MNKCLYCNSEIEEKTKSGKKRKYCNKSCSRKNYVSNNKKEVSIANKKGYQTLLETKGVDFIKHRGRSTSKKEKAIQKLIQSGHYNKMAELGNKALKQKGRTKEHIDRWRESYIANGHGVDNDLSWIQYSRKCRRLTLKLYGSAGSGMEWDHVVPLLYGYKNNISPQRICSKENIRLLTIKENRTKGHKLTNESYKVLKLWEEVA